VLFSARRHGKIQKKIKATSDHAQGTRRVPLVNFGIIGGSY
jgi:hypothetical protein